MSVDPYDLPLPERDRWGRPMLCPAGMTTKVPYTRASSLARFISGDYGLTKWRMRRLAKGMGNREDLAAMAGSLAAFHNDRELDRPTNTALDVIIEDALEAGQAIEQANHGTAVHGYTEPGPRGVPPARMADDVASFWAELERRGIRILATELFVANDNLMSAGTFDHAVEVDGLPGIFTLDKKTGDLHGIEFGVQLYVYASGTLYNVHTDQRFIWPEPMNVDRAIIAHIPPGKARTDLYWVDLQRGRDQALRAAATRDDQVNDAKMLTKFEEIPMAAPVSATGYTLELLQLEVAHATTRAQLEALWKDPQCAPFWAADAKLAAYAQRKWNALDESAKAE